MDNPKKFFSKILRVAGEYGARLRAFTPNARLYLGHVIVLGAVMGVFRLLFNFYALSLGFDEALLGNLITAGSFTALPLGYLSDIIGRKASLILSGALLSASILVMAVWQTETAFYSMNIVSGIAQSLAGWSCRRF